jgi:hypothetical protein
MFFFLTMVFIHRKTLLRKIGSQGELRIISEWKVCDYLTSHWHISWRRYGPGEERKTALWKNRWFLGESMGRSPIG